MSASSPSTQSPSRLSVSLPDEARLRAAAWALRIQFFVSGALFATWGVHVPTVKAHYGLGEQALAIAMLASGVGALLALTQAGRVVGRFGPRGVAGLTGVLCAAGVSLLIVPDAYIGLVLILMLFGATASLFDVAINAEATEIEHLADRPLMSGFHAMFSLGGMVGAGVGSLLPLLGWSTQTHLLAACGTGMALILLACPAMLKMTAAPGDKQPLSLPRGVLALIGTLAALGLIAEGAMYDWSVLFLKQERDSSASVAALGYASFSLAMALGRFAGDWVRARVAPVPLMAASGALAATGMALALVVPVEGAGLLGFALVGLGLSNVVPVLFSAASKVPGVSAAHGIAAVSSLGYLGMMSGPPLIGMVAEHASLTVGLACVVVFALIMAFSARRALGGTGAP
ncbi:MFS transporter [Roseateles aquatilis]|uniref:MFS transporter n=1 Tax=Roseateles aquatilis TaxID=431061 RepID=A0A246JI75_9BURK|nr:MFS transporter [Roseateles aquatilis]OWQ92275.1 MFS transporter [Roseateles aquatilis]